MKLTKQQKQALQNALDFGSPWRFPSNNTIGYESKPWRVALDRMHKKLWNDGLLNSYQITEAGIAALIKSGV